MHRQLRASIRLGYDQVDVRASLDVEPDIAPMRVGEGLAVRGMPACDHGRADVKHIERSALERGQHGPAEKLRLAECRFMHSGDAGQKDRERMFQTSV
jgi:hypothetical protein